MAAVVAANKLFYTCFQRGDAKGMARIWGKGDHVGVVHPGANLISGRDDVSARLQNRKALDLCRSDNAPISIG